MRNSFHQAAVTEESIGVMIHHLEAGAIELCSQHFFCQRHAHCIGDTLAQRTGCRFNTQMLIKFGMTCGVCTQLTKPPDVIHAQRIAGQIEQGIQQH